MKKNDKYIYKSLSHIVLQCARFCMSNNSHTSVFVIFHRICAPRIQLQLTAQWSQIVLYRYVEVQVKIVHKDV